MRKLILFALLSLFMTVGVFAQDPPGDFIDSDPELPVDSGIGLLLAAGVGYGIKKLYKKK
ncbi:MAG: hypothetical protein MUE96_08925 [Bacteroidia bacterium]|jgi:hypothetical protein|nr:hypothetical protein [Bacteroidia bacterium]